MFSSILIFWFFRLKLRPFILIVSFCCCQMWTIFIHTHQKKTKKKPQKIQIQQIKLGKKKKTRKNQTTANKNSDNRNKSQRMKEYKIWTILQKRPFHSFERQNTKQKKRNSSSSVPHYTEKNPSDITNNSNVICVSFALIRYVFDFGFNLNVKTHTKKKYKNEHLTSFRN